MIYHIGTDIVVDDKSVSRQHGVFTVTSSSLSYADNSKFGTHVTLKGSEEDLLHNDVTELSGDAEITMGTNDLKFRVHLRPFSFCFTTLPVADKKKWADRAQEFGMNLKF